MKVSLPSATLLCALRHPSPSLAPALASPLWAPGAYPLRLSLHPRSALMSIPRTRSVLIPVAMATCLLGLAPNGSAQDCIATAVSPGPPPSPQVSVPDDFNDIRSAATSSPTTRPAAVEEGCTS